MLWDLLKQLDGSEKSLRGPLSKENLVVALLLAQSAPRGVNVAQKNVFFIGGEGGGFLHDVRLI